MKVIYAGRISRIRTPTPIKEGDVIELLSNSWDDYGYKTSFPTTSRVNDKIVDLGPIRILVDGKLNTSKYLDKLLESGWNGEFPIPNTNYLSTPSEITLYEQLIALIGLAETIRIAEKLCDASLLTRVSEDEEALQLINTNGFKNSLQRERGSVKAFLDGWKLFTQQEVDVLGLGFRFRNPKNRVSSLNLNFKSERELPYDINALIGPNGSGKSQLLHQIVQNWLYSFDEEDTGFVESPNLSQLIVVSYSPFELFPVDIKNQDFTDKDIYRYFGLRGRTQATKASELGRVTLSKLYPQRYAANALIECLENDQRFFGLEDWARKLKTIEKVLKLAFHFDFAALRIKDGKRISAFYKDEAAIAPLHLTTESNGNKKRYIPIASDRVSSLDATTLDKAVVFDEGVTFFRNGKPINLSSGQRLFTYIVMNIVGAIRRNSLILIDEPELFLHPTLEVQFIDMLKRVLGLFDSKALLATHSVTLVREIPSECVHVFEETREEFFVKNPPFQTFGGDFQRISSYVFGDNSISKPFEGWIESEIERLGSGEALIESLGTEINEELLIQIRAMEN